MPGRRRALIVAVDEYEDPGLQRLRAPAQDAEALARVLADPELGDFEVSTLRNETHWTIGQRVEELLGDATLDDFILLHFSCHGIKDEAGELYLAAKNTRPSLLATTAVEAALVNRLVRRSRSQRVLLLLDCCFGGAFERGMAARATAGLDVADQFKQRDEDLGGGRGRVVITASSAMEFAFEGSDLADDTHVRPSVFTGALVEGLSSGAADRDNDGKFSLGEVYDYVFDRVRAVTPNQTPSKFEYGVQGGFVLARNPKWILVPGPLPATVVELANDPYAPTRLGIVADLKRLGGGVDLPLAAAARLQLDVMVNDDSKQVATAASAAIESLALRLSVSSVDLGRIGLGAPSPFVEVTIEGPPLAAASRVQSAAPEVRARKDDRTILIAVDTSRAGRIESHFKVDGPAGSVEVPVTAVLVDDGAASTESPPLEGVQPVASETLGAKQPAESGSDHGSDTDRAGQLTQGRTTESTLVGPRGARRSVVEALSKVWPFGVAAVVIAAAALLWTLGGSGLGLPSPTAPGEPSTMPSTLSAIESDAAGNIVRVISAEPPFGTTLRTGEHVVLNVDIHYRLVSHESALLIVSMGIDPSPAAGCVGGTSWISNSAPISRGEDDVSVSIVWSVGEDSKGNMTNEGFVGPVPSLWLEDQSGPISQFRASPDDCYPYRPG